MKESVFNPDDDDDIVYLLRFSQFYIECGLFHRASIAKNENPKSLVDKAGTSLNLQNLRAIGQRVMRGEDNEGNAKVLKLFSNFEGAEKELNSFRAIAIVLNYEVKASLIEGCGSPENEAMCAILDQYITGSMSVTFDHLINLVEQVDLMYQNGWVHGDLRAPNIRFLQSGNVSLIDLEWAGKAGEARFPDNINASAFRQRARDVIQPGDFIPSYFDWLCVADFLDAIGCPEAALAAVNLRKPAVMEELESCRVRGAQPEPGLGAGTGSTQWSPVRLDLSRLGGRLREFYSHTAE